MDSEFKDIKTTPSLSAFSKAVLAQADPPPPPKHLVFLYSGIEVGVALQCNQVQAERVRINQLDVAVYDLSSTALLSLQCRPSHFKTNVTNAFFNTAIRL